MSLFAEQLANLDACDTPPEQIRDFLAGLPKTNDVHNVLKESKFLFEFLSFLEYDLEPLEQELEVEIVRAYLDLCPEAAGVSSTYCGFEDEDAYFLLHAACQNRHIAEERIFELLIDASPPKVFSRLSTLERLLGGCGEHIYSGVAGTPLHYYVAWGRSSLGVVKRLVEACPEALAIVDGTDKGGVTPLHAMMDTYYPGEKDDVIRYLIEQNPSVLRTRNGFGLPIHALCSNHNATLDVLKLLVEAWPESVCEKEKGGRTPISILALNYISDIYSKDFDSKIEYLVKMSGEDKGGVFVHLLEEMICGSDDCLPYEAIKKLFEMIPGYKTDAFNAAIKKSPFLHRFLGCSGGRVNDQITLKILETLLDVYPEAANITSNVSCDESRKSSFSYPLHEACAAHYLGCQDEIVAMLVQKTEPAAFRKMCVLGRGLLEESEGVAGTPLHYYVTHGSNAETVKLLVEKCPEAVTIMHRREKLTPLHVTIMHKFISFHNTDTNVVKFLVETNPATLRIRNENGRLPIHEACQNGRMNAEIVKVLLDTWPESIMERCAETDLLPLHFLCINSRHYNVYPELDDKIAVDILELLLERAPQCVRELIGDDEELPIHFAAAGHGPKFCRMLIEHFPGSERIGGMGNATPLIKACAFGRAETVKYLAELLPESINEQFPELTPFHASLRSEKIKDKLEKVQYFLKKNPCLASKAIQDCFPLHLSCSTCAVVEVVKFLFDKYPPAILVADSSGDLPHDVAEYELNEACWWRKNESEKVVAFLKAQHLYLTQIGADSLTSPDENGCLLLHHALDDKAASLGTIESIVKENPNALHVPDKNGKTPFHLACKKGTVEVIQFLLSLDPSLVNAVDNYGSNPLHYACTDGNLEAARFLLGQCTWLVCAENNKKLLPIHLLCDKSGKEDMVDSKKYVDLIWHLLLAYPETVAPGIIA